MTKGYYLYMQKLIIKRDEQSSKNGTEEANWQFIEL